MCALFSLLILIIKMFCFILTSVAQNMSTDKSRIFLYFQRSLKCVFFWGRKRIQNCKLSYSMFRETKCESTQLTVLYMEYAAKTWNKDCCLEKDVEKENAVILFFFFVKTKPHKISELCFGNLFLQFNSSSTKEQDKNQSYSSVCFWL